LLAQQVAGLVCLSDVDVPGVETIPLRHGWPGWWNTGQRHVVAGDEAEVIALDSLNLAPDFIKLDVEGMEYHALIGAEQTIRTHRPVVMFEGNGCNRRYGVPDGEAGRLLESWGMRRVLTSRSNPPDEDWVYAW
jgi:hypothetical protein